MGKVWGIKSYLALINDADKHRTQKNLKASKSILLLLVRKSIHMLIKAKAIEVPIPVLRLRLKQ